MVPFLSMAALVRARRGEADAARSLIQAALAHRTQGSSVAPEVDCDLVAEAGDWQRVAEVVGRARDLSLRGGLLALPAYADRLEGRAALAAGDPARALERLEAARQRFAEIGARWERAFTELRMAEAQISVDDAVSARSSLGATLPLLEELSSLREIDQSRALLDRLG